MKNQMELAFLILLLFLYGIAFAATPAVLHYTPQEVVKKMTEGFQKIKDARADITLDTNLEIFGCSGNERYAGYGIFSAPDKIKAVIDKNIFYIRGNDILRIDPDGKHYRIQLVHAPDFSPGFHPGLITHNFYLRMAKETPEEIAIEGMPRPGVLKNIKKVIFFIDPKEFLLRELKMVFTSKKISGKAEVNYEKINNLWVPVETRGKSAVEINSGLSALVGFNFALKGTNVRINSGVSEKELNP